MSVALGVMLSVCTAAPQGVSDVFSVRTVPGVEGRSPRIFLEADRRQITCLDALRALAGAVNWNLVIESPPLQNDLSYASVDLSLGRSTRRFQQTEQKVREPFLAISARDVTNSNPGEPGARFMVRIPAIEAADSSAAEVTA